MNVIPIVVGAYQVNCYLAVSDTKQVIVIDPGDDAGQITATLRQQNLTVVAYLVTHGHYDHIGALSELADHFPAPIGIHPDDEVWAFSPDNQGLPYYDTPERPKHIERHLADGQKYEDGGMQYEVLATPGHSPGGVCFYFPAAKTLFSGDTLFSGSIGRTDFEGSDPELMDQSLRRLIQLPDDTLVYPGHGPRTTIGREKRVNPFLRFGA